MAKQQKAIRSIKHTAEIDYEDYSSASHNEEWDGGEQLSLAGHIGYDAQGRMQSTCKYFTFVHGE